MGLKFRKLLIYLLFIYAVCLAVDRHRPFLPRGLNFVRTYNTLALGDDAYLRGEQKIPLFKPEEFDFMARERIMELRTEVVYLHPNLLRRDYIPSELVFGQVVDQLPWWGIAGKSSYGPGERSIEGSSYESLYILNPFLLVGLADSSAHRLFDWRGKAAAVYPRPVSLAWYPDVSKARVRYDLSGYWKSYIDIYGDGVWLDEQDLDVLKLVAVNARDFRMRYMCVIPRESSGIIVDGLDNDVTLIKQYFSLASSCGYPGGCNVLLPENDAFNIKVQNLPAVVYIKLWQDKPRDIYDQADMTFIIEML